VVVQVKLQGVITGGVTSGRLVSTVILTTVSPLSFHSQSINLTFSVFDHSGKISVGIE